MPSHAKSQAAKHRSALLAACKHKNHAVQTYNDKMKAWENGEGKKPSFRSVAERFGLDHNLLRHRQKGIGRSKQESNALKSHLTEQEATTLIDFTLEMVHWGFPLDLKNLEKHAHEIIRAHWPDFSGFGKTWAQRFLVKYGSKVSTQWSMSLDTVRAKSVNQSVVKHYYDLLEKVLQENNFHPQNIYGFDETGYPIGCGNKCHVIGQSKNKQHKLQCNNNKEMVMVMATICVDGSNVLPVVIFKGQNFLEQWHQDNPIDAAWVLESSCAQILC
jgi:hypothetical protein